MEYSNEAIAIKSESELHKFPTVILQMIPHEGGIGDEVETNDPREVPGLSGNIDTSMPNDILLAIPPKHYMQRNSKDGTYTSRIYLDRDDGLGNVLGANTMMGHDILFDLDGARIGFSESECDYAKLVSESGSASEVINEGDSMLGEAALWEEEEEDDDVMICESVKCRTLFGLTVAGLAFVLFYFARKYVNKPLTDASREYEMKSSANLHSRRRSYSDELPPPRYSDDNAPSSSYSDRRSSRSERSSGGGSRRDRSGSEERRHSQERRSSARSSASADGGGSLRSGRSGRNSIHSHRSERSTGSGGSGGSRETRQSTSARSHLSRESHRSSHSHESGGGRSHRSGASGGSRTHRSSSNRSSGSRERGASGASGSTRYRDDYDEVIPPAIC